MRDVRDSSVLFTGSVPLSSEEDVFLTCSREGGAHVFALPDGELGEREKWAGCLPELTFKTNPDLEEVPEQDFPHPLDVRFRSKGVETFRIKDGVERPTIDNLPYAEAAFQSYEIFKRLREEGQIPSDVRFQVAIPTPYAAIRAFFPDVSTWPQIFDAVSQGLHDQIATVCERIPPEELVIQIDVASEIVDAYEADPGMGEPERREQIVRDYSSREYLAPLTGHIPDETILGYHICLGTHPSYGGWPGAPVADLSSIVALANAMVANTPRRVDYLHLPSVVDADAAYFAPLRDLDVGDARIFLGLEAGDGLDGLLRRAASAKTAIDDFGIAHYCGYGRDVRDQVPGLIKDLHDAAEQLAGS